MFCVCVCVYFLLMLKHFSFASVTVWLSELNGWSSSACFVQWCGRENKVPWLRNSTGSRARHHRSVYISNGLKVWCLAMKGYWSFELTAYFALLLCLFMLSFLFYLLLLSKVPSYGQSGASDMEALQEAYRQITLGECEVREKENSRSPSSLSTPECLKRTTQHVSTTESGH